MKETDNEIECISGGGSIKSDREGECLRQKKISVWMPRKEGGI